MRGIAHWDEVEPERAELGHLHADWFDLGTAAGSMHVGVQRIRIVAGKWSTPAHIEHGEEEIFWVLGGSGLSWQDAGEGPSTHAVGPGDCLVHRVQEHAHTLRAGDEGLDVLAFGPRLRTSGAYLPRANVSWLGPSWVRSGEDPWPWQREVDVGEPEVPAPSPRPGTIVHVDDVEAKRRDGATVARERRDLGRAAGSVLTGIKHVRVPEGKLGAPPHCHSAEEEILVVIEGDGVVILGQNEHPVRAGSVVARPAGTGVAHAFRAGPGGLTYLAYGTREPPDICFYPRSGKLSLGGVGVIGVLQPLDYWHGED